MTWIFITRKLKNIYNVDIPPIVFNKIKLKKKTNVLQQQQN